ncbi:MAG: cytochrome C [Myxococcota bacterium]
MSAPVHARVFDWQRRRRLGVVALSLVSVALFAVSYFQPWWQFDLFAPQYPKGLELVVSLTGVTGDTEEINIINHYIGMGHLEDAAELERAYGGWLVGGLGVAVLALVAVAGKRLGWLAWLAAVGFPVGFVADTMYWLYRFGHDLDPKAPVRIPGFTPEMFGEGKVGQFRTIATPDLGFWLAVTGVVLVGIAAWQRKKVCATCPAQEDCHATCPRAFVGVPK